jgi:hypothetical protein
LDGLRSLIEPVRLFPGNFRRAVVVHVTTDAKGAGAADANTGWPRCGDCRVGDYEAVAHLYGLNAECGCAGTAGGLAVLLRDVRRRYPRACGLLLAAVREGASWRWTPSEEDGRVVERACVRAGLPLLVIPGSGV